MTSDPNFIEFLWLVFTQTWLGSLPLLLLTLIGLTAYHERRNL